MGSPRNFAGSPSAADSARDDDPPFERIARAGRRIAISYFGHVVFFFPRIAADLRTRERPPVARYGLSAE